jgi:GNAT superfamily N-acetyltransferase
MVWGMLGDNIVAVALVNARKGQLTVLNVCREYRGRGVGEKMVSYLACNFARVLDTAVPFFERCGYVKIGSLKKGRALNTQVMIRKSLLSLAGRVKKIRGQNHEDGLV